MGKLPHGKLLFGKMYNWEVAAWEIAHLGSCHLGNCHLGSCPWEKAFGKEPNTIFTVELFDRICFFLRMISQYLKNGGKDQFHARL